MLNCKVNLTPVLKTDTYYCLAREPLFLSEFFVNTITFSEHFEHKFAYTLIRCILFKIGVS